jgi:hypothetical protein
MAVVPGVSWLMVLALAWATYRKTVGHALAEFKRQVHADMAMCRELSAS